tara:strand:+ start:1018 stop:4164 length:3147 start_codon:yes stop_codon:yes gene_type:complete
MYQILKSSKPIFSLSSSKLFILLFFLSLTAFSQENRVSGTVTDITGEILLGVSVIEKGTTNGVVTDFDGNYSLQLRGNAAVLEFSYVGFETVELVITDERLVNITLKPSSEELDEVVVIGYGTVKKRDVLGSIGSVKNEELMESIPVDALAALQGRIAGVQVTSNGGAPGESSEIIIRGISTLSQGGIGPLYVVDGQQVDNIDNINPNDIESIDVLKDGASAAIYGSKSANGVVMITTKKGEAGFVKIRASAQTSVSVFNQKIPVSNSAQRRIFELERTTNTSSGGYIRTANDTLDIRTQVSNDLQDMITQVGYKNQVNFSFSGGSETTKLYWSTSILKQKGIVIGSGYERFTSSLKADFDVNKVISAGTRTNITYQKSEGFSESSVFRSVSYRQSNLLVHDYDGSYFPIFSGRSNPVAIADLSKRDNRQFRVSNYNYISFKITPELAFKTTFGVNFNYNKRNDFNPSATVDVTRPITGKERNILTYDFQSENYFTYKKKFKGGHSVSGLLGLSVQKWKNETSTLDAIAFNNDYIETFNNVGQYDTEDTGSIWRENALSSVYGRATYDFKKKYFFAASFRRDGSSRFGSNKQWGNFPSASVGWNINKENFMKSNSIFSDLKLRASYAITGNERIPDYLNQALYSPGYFYDGVNGMAPSQLGNADLGWEETAQQNYGLDFSFFKRRLKLTVDAYVKTTTDLLYAVRIPGETGIPNTKASSGQTRFTTITANVGSVENRGLEILLSGTVVQAKDFKWFASFNIAFNKNKVLSLADPDGFETGGYFVEVGKPIGNMYGYKNLGVFQYDESNAFTDDGVQLTPNFDENGAFENHTLNGEEFTGNINQLKYAGNVLIGGDIIWEDQNEDFNINVANDRVTIGNGLPDFIGGFRNTFDYKDFALSFLLDFNFGNDIYRNYDHVRDKSSSSSYTPGPDRILNAWRNPGDDTHHPSLKSNRANNRSGFDSNYVSSADYIRLQNINLSYRFPKKILKKTNFLDQLTLNLVANNVFTFTNYEGYNPSLGSRGVALQPGWDSLRYPNKIEFVFGVVAQF